MPAKPKSTPSNADRVLVRDLRNQPFYMVNRYLFGMKLSWRALLAYNAVAYYSWPPPCQTTTGAMAEAVGVSYKTIQRGIEELQKKKLVLVTQRVEQGAGRRGQMSNEYALTDPDATPI